CNSPDQVGPLVDGQHTVSVRAADPSNQVDSTPASRSFTVDATPPDTSIDSGPADGSVTNTPTPSFGFSANESGATLECSIDEGAFSSCGTPHQLGPLGEGQHTFAVRAIDAAQNVDPTPASRTFTVDLTPPETTIDSGPADGSHTNDPSPSFGF